MHLTTVPMDEDVKTRLIRSRINMILHAPFFGHIAMRLQMHQVPDDSPVQTMATDGRYFFFNKRFVDGLRDEELVFGFGHETVHAVFEHAGGLRSGNRDPRTWNEAVDYVTNQMLVDNNIGAPVTSNGFKIYQDNKYKNWSAEQVYEDLIKKKGKMQMPGQGTPGPGSPGGSGGGQSSQEMREPGQLDHHLNTGAAQETGNDENGNPQFVITEGGPLGDMTHEQRQLQQELRQAVIAAAKSVEASQKGKSAGLVPAGIQKMIDEWTETVIDWRELLSVSYSSLFRDDYSYSRPSKKSWATNCVLPGLKDGEFVEIAIAIDTSGSISAREAGMFLGETYGIMKMFQDFKIHLWTFDGTTHGYETFTPDNLEELKQYVPKGGGGTSFEANWALMRKLELVPNQFVMFTDGMPGGSWGDPDYCDTIFVITTPRIKAPFGRSAYFDLHEAA